MFNNGLQKIKQQKYQESCITIFNKSELILVRQNEGQSEGLTRPLVGRSLKALKWQSHSLGFRICSSCCRSARWRLGDRFLHALRCVNDSDWLTIVKWFLTWVKYIVNKNKKDERQANGQTVYESTWQKCAVGIKLRSGRESRCMQAVSNKTGNLRTWQTLETCFHPLEGKGRLWAQPIREQLSHLSHSFHTTRKANHKDHHSFVHY